MRQGSSEEYEARAGAPVVAVAAGGGAENKIEPQRRAEVRVRVLPEARADGAFCRDAPGAELELLVAAERAGYFREVFGRDLIRRFGVDAAKNPGSTSPVQAAGQACAVRCGPTAPLRSPGTDAAGGCESDPNEDSEMWWLLATTETFSYFMRPADEGPGNFWHTRFGPNLRIASPILLS